MKILLNQRIAIFGILLALVPCFVSAQEESTLESLELEYHIQRSKLLAPLTELQDKYVGYLNDLLAEVTKSGELEKVLAVNEELKNYKSGSPKPGPGGFPKLKQLQEIYAKSSAGHLAKIEKQSAPLVAGFRDKLVALQVKLTQQSKIQEAVQVKARIDKLDASTESVATAKSPEPAGLTPIGPETQGQSGTLRVAGSRYGGGGPTPMLPPKGRDKDFVQIALTNAAGWTGLRKSGEIITSTSKPLKIRRVKSLSGWGYHCIALLESGKLEGGPEAMRALEGMDITNKRFDRIASLNKVLLGVENDGSVYCNWPIPDQIPETELLGIGRIAVTDQFAGFISATGKVWVWGEEGLVDTLPKRTFDAVGFVLTFARGYVLESSGALVEFPLKKGIELLLPPDLTARRIRGGTGVLAVEFVDGTWKTFGQKMGAKVHEALPKIRDPVDLEIYKRDTSNFLVWIERE